ncbi:MAG: Yip1 family protein [Pseudomonadales bacterium]
MQPFFHALRLLIAPKSTWQAIADKNYSAASVLLFQTLPMALIPAACWYYGVTQVGWSVAGETMRLTSDSALPLCVMFYLAMVSGILFMGFMVRWMSSVYGQEGSYATGIALISFTATPFFVAGLLGLSPVLWVDITLGVVVACYSIYLLYLGVGPLMRVTPDRSFLYASALFAVALVSFVGVLTATALLWEFGPAPEYTY